MFALLDRRLSLMTDQGDQTQSLDPFGLAVSGGPVFQVLLTFRADARGARIGERSRFASCTKTVGNRQGRGWTRVAVYDVLRPKKTAIGYHR